MTDAVILAKITGGALVVAGADTLHRQQLADGLGSLEAVDARVLGIVLNRLKDRKGDAYSYYVSTGTRAGTENEQTRKATSRQRKQGTPGAGMRPSPSPSDRSERSIG